jgi:hypothetical protein
MTSLSETCDDKMGPCPLWNNLRKWVGLQNCLVNTRPLTRGLKRLRPAGLARFPTGSSTGTWIPLVECQRMLPMLFFTVSCLVFMMLLMAV